MDSLNHFSILPTEITAHTFSNLPEKDYGLFNLISKNFCNPLWQQYLTERNIKVVDTGQKQVYDHVRHFCKILLIQPDIKKHLLDHLPISIFEAKEFTKKLLSDKKTYILRAFEDAFWTQIVYIKNNVPENDIHTLLEFDTKTFKAVYQLYATKAITSDLNKEITQKFIEKLIQVSSGEDLLKYLNVAIDHQKFNVINMILPHVAIVNSTSLNNALNKQLPVDTIIAILEKLNNCDLENIYSALANNYADEILLPIIQKFCSLTKGSNTDHHFFSILKREYSEDVFRALVGLMKSHGQDDHVLIKQILNKHVEGAKNNKKKWMHESYSKEMLAMLLMNKIDCETFLQYYEYKIISLCYAKASEPIKKNILTLTPLAALNLTVEQFILVSKSKTPPHIQNIKEAGRDALVIDDKEISLFSDKSKKTLKLKINAASIDIYSQESFALLIQQQKEHNLSSFIVIWKNPRKEELTTAEAVSFMRQYYKFDNKLDPTTRDPVESFEFYKSCKVSNQFKFFASEQSLRTNNDHFAKQINATDLNIDPAIRGQERFYMADCCEEKAVNFLKKISGDQENDITLFNKALKNYDKAKFWLEKAIEDKNVDAYLVYANWHRKGNLVTTPSKTNFVKYLKFAALEVPDTHKQAKEILSKYLQTLKLSNVNNSNNTIDIEYCLKRLKTL